MKENSRTSKALRNTAVTTVCQMFYLILSFVCRTIFTNLLGAEYLGINGLFSNILTILSFAELGIGSALVYRMYAPLAYGDNDKVVQFLKLYRRIYNVIILVIILIGLALIPFLEYLVEAPDVEENVALLYLLYLFDTVVSYSFVYKKSLLIADQRNYVVSIFTQIFNVIMNIVQIIGLILTHNFVLYCVIRTICTLLCNIVCSLYADKKYPYILLPAKGKLSKGEIEGLKKDVKGLLLTKVASTAFSGTDNIFISVFIGLKYVGILSNYTLLLTTVNTVMNKIFDSITSSIGNLALSGDTEKTEEVLNKLFFLNTGIYGYLSLGIYFLIEKFVTEIWFTEEYALPNFLVMLIIVELFFRSIHYPLYTTRNALGAFSQHKVIFAAAALLNIVLDFILVKPMGISGLYLATIICRGITYIVDAWVVYHEAFHKSVMIYLTKIIQWIVFLLVNGAVIYFVLNRVCIEGIMGLCFKLAIITAIYLFMFWSVYHNTTEYKYYLQLAKKIILK